MRRIAQNSTNAPHASIVHCELSELEEFRKWEGSEFLRDNARLLVVWRRIKRCSNLEVLGW